jgi:hypothetical protein
MMVEMMTKETMTTKMMMRWAMMMSKMMMILAMASKDVESHACGIN